MWVAWEAYRRYDDPKMPSEWCRPIPFPGETVFYDHTNHGGYMDMDFLSAASNLDQFVFCGKVWARDLLRTESRETIFARPVGMLAFSNLLDEKVRITRGEGVWIPIARQYDNDWHLFPWSKAMEPLISAFMPDPSAAYRLNHNMGSKLYVNEALALLENVFFDRETESSEKAQNETLKKAIELLESAVQTCGWDWYAERLLCDLKKVDIHAIPAIVHSDRIYWYGTHKNREGMDEEFNLSMSVFPDYELALYNYSVCLLRLGFTDDGIQVLSHLLEINPIHSQANFEMALIDMKKGDEESEIKRYMISAENDPHFAAPLYNLGKTYEDKGQINLAKKFYSRAIEVDPFYAEALEQLGFIAHDEGDNELAKEYFMRALKADGQRIITYEHVVWFADQTKDTDLLSVARNLFQDNLPREFETYWH
jgi:tetratricopeptide (TPR) repeat protein